mmetsp:Transcript_44700/g.103332  ORF Transcript_44700/g.103332 Transcript_44700/m.103332 type:complete len:310 (-) Transcript_44700:41-970(-)
MRTLHLVAVFLVACRGVAALALHARTDAPTEAARVQDIATAPENQPPPVPKPRAPPYEVAEEIQRPLMKSINTMRSALCMGRPDLARHEKCMKFLTRHCRSESTGHGYCKEFKQFLAAQCEGGNERSCVHAKELGDKVELPESEAHAGDAEDEEIDEDIHVRINASHGGNATPVEEPVVPPAAPEVKAEVAEEEEVKIEKAEKAVEDQGKYPGGYPSTSIEPATDAGFPGKSERSLPDQGYNEHSSEEVQHDDMETYTADWHKEVPRNGTSRVSICEEQPDFPWCQLFLKDAKRQGIKAESERISDAVE